MENCPVGQRGPNLLDDPFKSCQPFQRQASMEKGQHRWMQNSCLISDIKREHTADGRKDGLPMVNIETHDDYPWWI